MANILLKVGQSFNISVHIYEADTEEDMNTIDLQGVPMGSKCHIINDGKWYMLNSKSEWKIMPSGGSGADGHTPQRGVDYWTTEDQQAIVDDVLAALPTWTGGSY